MQIPEKYADRVRVTEAGCWLWTGAVVGLHNKTGSLAYGVCFRNNKPTRVHRYFFELATGVAPGKNHVHHKCGNTLCVNPDHLELLSHAEHNRLHGKFRDRAEELRESETCLHGHLWSENAYFNKGTRFCRECKMELQRRSRKAKGEGQLGKGYWEKQRTHCPQGHPYAGENLWVDARGYRHCRACNLKAGREAVVRKRPRLKAQS